MRQRMCFNGLDIASMQQSKERANQKQRKIGERLRTCFDGLDIAKMLQCDCEKHGQNGERPCNDKDTAAMDREHLKA